MKTIQLIQGSAEWHAHRAQFLNASDAPAMMGCSPYKTRAELVRERATGLAAEVDASQQRRFDVGHRAEALARPLAEQILGEDLSPLVGVADEGPYSASFDGLTLMEDQAFEHKALNDTLRAAMVEGCIGADLPMPYQVQMEHQCMVCPSIERVLFMASKWADDGTLIEERHCFYEPNLALRARIVAGWEQFEQDVAAYAPAPAAAPAPVAKVVASLPVVLDMRVEGRLISCNLEQYKPAALAYIAAINTDLITDQDFADADADAKFCRESASKLKLAIEQAMGQMGDINTAISTVREIATAFDAKGLALEKLVKSEKEARRDAIVHRAIAAQREHAAALVKRLGGDYLPALPADFAGAVKGKRNLESMQDAVGTVLTQYKIAANQAADGIDANLKLLAEHQEFAGLFPDVKALVQKQIDDLRAVISSRIAQHEAEQRAAQEQLRARIAAEERAKAEAAARAEQDRINAAAEAERQRQLEADRARIRAEEEERAQRTQQAIDAERRLTAQPAAPAPAPALQPAPLLQPVAAAAPASNDLPSAGAVPTLRIGDIANRLGWTMTAEQLRGLGIEPAAKERGATLFHEHQFPQICAAIAQRATEAAAAHAQRMAA
ncbi:lambda-exonuclease family protein [Xenophilus sp. Marseille-Q4582]|uniref:lambda-exonuclease family protein n=1 Tax=Xenophilus sp. Marseille-Q4582 TaxID=2866600 RepID=UPI001CE467AA|nr:YqaJ viral recombinase family protein [Xenophilus sp. Marseille-Q4582]